MATSSFDRKSTREMINLLLRAAAAMAAIE
jgi:hypothetical protein